MSRFPIFTGNCPRNVAKDAKYSVRSGKSGPVVTLTYRSQEDERWYATTEEHPELVNMVNEVKLSDGQPPNGAFYINEYRQVIVPTGVSDAYYLAGTYTKTLCFEFEEKILTCEPVDLEGNPLSTGDTWVGPHPGIRYVLCAGGTDIKYVTRPRPNVEKDIKLSKAIGDEGARAMASRILAIKGHAGGRFYVNEAASIFAPIKEGADWKYVYIGQLDLNSWFPNPHSD